VDAIVEAHPEIDTLDVKTLGKNEYPDLHEYHLIGVATGIYYSEIDKDMARVLTNVLQPQDKVFGLMTYGGTPCGPARHRFASRFAEACAITAP